MTQEFCLHFLQISHSASKYFSNKYYLLRKISFRSFYIEICFTDQNLLPLAREDSKNLTLVGIDESG